MESLFSTARVQRRNRFDAWHSVACKAIVPHDAIPDSRQDFRAELRASRMGELDFVLFENSGMTVNHGRHHSGLMDDDRIFLCAPQTGCLELEQIERGASLDPGGLILLDPRLPYAARFRAGSKTLVLKLPRRELEARLGNSRRIIARPLKPGADCRIASAMLPILAGNAAALSASAAAVLAQQFLELFAIACAGNQASEPGSISRLSALHRVRAAIDARLSDPMANPAMIAEAAGVSVRYANLILADQGTSMMRLVLETRLERCRRALADASQAGRTVAEIAYGWGFSDVSHFGRTFRSAYGEAPREYRNRAKRFHGNAPIKADAKRNMCLGVSVAVADSQCHA